jgi:methenyltetrahydrofolate cyclohydrolase
MARMTPLVFSQGSLRDFLASLASAEAPQDAVTAASIAAGMGTALLQFITALPKTRSDSLNDRKALLAAATALGEIQEQLLEAVDTETAVKVFAARQLPGATATERTAREAAMQLALRTAADVPLEVMRLSTQALTQAQVVARHSLRARGADIELAVALIRAAFDGARSNLEAKLSSLTDVLYLERVVEEIARLSDEVVRMVRDIEVVVKRPSA